jgi:hypothetical protein
MAFGSYVTAEGRKNLVTYRYSGEDRSLLYKHVLSPFADYCVRNFTPMNIA